MLKTYYDQEILEDLHREMPSSLMDEKGKAWMDYFNFLKTSTDLTITHYDDANPPELILGLVSGRGDSKLSCEPAKINFHKNIVPSKYGINDVFFVTENDAGNRNKLRNNNHHFFGFKNEHFQAFGKLSQMDKPESILIRKDPITNEFKNWDQLVDYLLPFSDCIITDNFLFSDGIQPQNFERLLIQLAKATSLKFSLLILTYKGDREEVDVNSVYEEIQTIKLRNKINADITLIATRKLEHDRHIIMNYMKIISGSSLNFLDMGNKPKANTTIYFQPYTTCKHLHDVMKILSDLKPELSEIIKTGNPKVIRGEGKCKLFDLQVERL